MDVPKTVKTRIESIDVLRGIVMVLMALDHVRDYFHIGANTDDPLNLATTTPILFFTRWITHFCAPIFVFLSGCSAYLQSLRKSKTELGVFLLKRGLWLIFAELVIISFGWTFNPFFNVTPFQVIWAIGISMVVLGMLIVIRLPYFGILLSGLIIVFGHNLLDIPEAAPGFKAGFWWDILHHGVFTPYQIAPGHNAMLVYPFLPWAGLMMLGYCAGLLFTSRFSQEQRMKILLRLGAVILLFFIALRFANVYGDPLPWSVQKNPLYTFLSFIKINKYPPSLLYICITIGVALIFLSLVEKVRNRFTGIMMVYGRTAFFYYVVHLYLIHLISAICFFARGHSFDDAGKVGQRFPFMFVAPGEGYGLFVVYGVWAVVVIALYPLCKRWDRYKTSHRNRWWLSYL
jgi:uncharacterized membrane protein